MSLRSLSDRLMYLMPTPNFAPPNEGGQGGIPDDDGFDDDDIEDELDDDDSDDGEPAPRKKKTKSGDSGDDDEISIDDPDFLSQFWDEGDDEDDDDDDHGDSPEAQEALAKEVKEMLEGIRITEEMIPENFDPSDPKQFRDVVGKIQQETARSTMRAMFKPMAAALNQQTSRMRKEFKEYVEEHGSSSSLRARLTEEIPAAGDRQNRKFLQIVMEQAKNKFPKSQENQLRSARKALHALGITKDSSSSRAQGRAAKTPGSALDLFAPLPRKSESRAQGRMRTR